MSVPGTGPRADVLAKLLMIQSTAGQLRNESAILSFVCRGLLQVPGVADARHVEDVSAPGPADGETSRFPLRRGRSWHGAIELRLASREEFLAYAPHVGNLAFMVAVMLEERRQRRQAEQHQQELESRVAERTRLLSDEVRERRSAEATALAQKQRAEGYLDIAETIIVELDLSATVQVINRRGCDLLGTSLHEAVGCDWLGLAVPSEEHASVRAVLDALVRTRSPRRSESRIVTRTGERRDVSWRHGLHVENGEVVGTVSSGLDVTERARHEQEREALLLRERAARLEAQEANEAKDRFLAVLSHELRTPLTPIPPATELLRRTLPAEHAGHRALAIIDRNVKFEARLIDDLLDVVRIRRGTLKVTETPMALCDVVMAVLESQQPEFDRMGIHITTELADCWVMGDPDRVQQIASNLLSNAAKFTPAGGEVRVRLEEDGSAVRLVVEDTGAGIDPGLLPHVFEIFHQGQSDGHRNPGLGIGLALVKSLAEMQGGRVWATSAGSGKGSRFTVELRRASSPSERGLAEPRRGGPTAEAVRVLVVEDNPDTRSVLEEALGIMSYAVTSAPSAEDALESLRLAQPDVILADIGLPGIDGYEFLRRARALPGFHAAAFAVTGFGLPEDFRRSRDAGFAGHFVKPVDLDDLDRRVRATLNGSPPSPACTLAGS